ncbi:hypothetical protein P4597_19285 [Peribacillus simplex]|uniref:hypothetical protein n=1 Tax=Peribacillus simplex TaxID=1478 RepID=UPI002E22E64C|nr:hypothetical protein [Peribacillus simplex]
MTDKEYELADQILEKLKEMDDNLTELKGVIRKGFSEVHEKLDTISEKMSDRCHD